MSFFCSLASEPIWGEAEASGNLGEGSKLVTRPKVPTSKLQSTLLAPLLTSPYSSMATQSSLPQALCTGYSSLWGGPAVCLLVHLAGSHSLSKFSTKYGLISKVRHTPLPSKRSPHQILSEILSLASKHSTHLPLCVHWGNSLKYSSPIRSEVLGEWGHGTRKTWHISSAQYLLKEEINEGRKASLTSTGLLGTKETVFKKWPGVHTFLSFKLSNGPVGISHIKSAINRRGCKNNTAWHLIQ